MIEILKSEDCCGCLACYNKCPKHCIMINEDDDGFYYPVVNKEQCINCSMCEKACPMNNCLELNKKPISYGAINRSDKIRRLSSSGGVFYLLCDYIIQNNGVVFGVKFDKNFDVCHSYSETIEDCKEFMGSKYSQSYIGDSYIGVQHFLNAGRYVLFTGTPCQVAGLYSFLGNKKYDNLLTLDIVCHSVPSPKRWQMFKESISNSENIDSINFRDKITGWSSGSFVMKFKNGSEYSEFYAKTDFMKGFLKGEYSRPSCYDCKFSTLQRVSDITLGDFWGIEGLCSKLYDNLGTSLVLINSKKGKRIFKIIKKDLVYKRFNLEKAIKYNPAIYSSCKRNSKYD